VAFVLVVVNNPPIEFSVSSKLSAPEGERAGVRGLIGG